MAVSLSSHWPVDSFDQTIEVKDNQFETRVVLLLYNGTDFRVQSGHKTCPVCINNVVADVTRANTVCF